MAKNKLAKFAEMETLPNVFQYPFAKLKEEEGFPLRGKWRQEFFGNDAPIVLELGCGKGEYTVGLGKLYPEKNFIGIDIKGARMWSGAKSSHSEGMKNVAFLRTDIELLAHFFASDEVSEIWITFPDPQMKKVNKRLTGTRFMRLYRQVLEPNGLLHLKTDSPFLYTYTKAMAELNTIEMLTCTDDLYASAADDKVLSIKTYYEQQWLERGLSIKYIAMKPAQVIQQDYIEPDIEIELDSYRSFNRSKRSAASSGK